MRGWIGRKTARKLAAALTVLALLLSQSSTRDARPHHEEQIGAPEHSHVLADSGSARRPLTVLQHRSLFAARVFVPATTHARVSPRAVSRLVARAAVPLPPARMRYRRSTHDADAEPPA